MARKMTIHSLYINSDIFTHYLTKSATLVDLPFNTINVSINTITTFIYSQCYKKTTFVTKLLIYQLHSKESYTYSHILK